MKYNSKAFTILELLVVIAILCILSALLLPGLRKSIQSAKSIACANNLKQIYVWAVTYAEDWRGVLPHNGGDPYGRGYEYLSSSTWYAKNPGYDSSAEGNTVMHCPAVKSIDPLHVNNRGYTYSLNHYLGGRKSWANGRPSPKVPRVKNLTLKKYWFADSKYADYGGYLPDKRLLATSINKNERSWPWPWMVSYSGKNWATHPNYSANFVFGDGHCKGVAWEQVSYGMTSAELTDWEHTSP